MTAKANTHLFILGSEQLLLNERKNRIVTVKLLITIGFFIAYQPVKKWHCFNEKVFTR